MPRLFLFFAAVVLFATPGFSLETDDYGFPIEDTTVSSRSSTGSTSFSGGWFGRSRTTFAPSYVPSRSYTYRAVNNYAYAAPANVVSQSYTPAVVESFPAAAAMPGTSETVVWTSVTPTETVVSSPVVSQSPVVTTTPVPSTGSSKLLVGYSRFFRGNKILETTDADFAYVQWHVNF